MYIFQNEQLIKLRFWLKNNMADSLLKSPDLNPWGAILGRYVRQNQPTLPSWRLPCFNMEWYATGVTDKAILLIRKGLRFCVATAGGHFEHSV